MRRFIRVAALLVVLLSVLLVGPGSVADSAGTWVAVYSFEVPAGAWSEGTHTYRFEWEWTEPAPGSFSSPTREFTVSAQAPLYMGSALLRLGAVKAWAPEPGTSTCVAVEAIHPDQPTRFLVGWINDEPMTHEEAQAHLGSMTARVVWDEVFSAELTRVQVVRWFGTGRDWDCPWAIRR